MDSITPYKMDKLRQLQGAHETDLSLPPEPPTSETKLIGAEIKDRRNGPIRRRETRSVFGHPLTLLSGEV